MPRAWFVQVRLQDNRTFLIPATSAGNARVRGEAIFADGFAAEVFGTGGDVKTKLHPLREIKEITVFWEGEDA